MRKAPEHGCAWETCCGCECGCGLYGCVVGCDCGCGCGPYGCVVGCGCECGCGPYGVQVHEHEQVKDHIHEQMRVQVASVVGSRPSLNQSRSLMYPSFVHVNPRSGLAWILKRMSVLRLRLLLRLELPFQHQPHQRLHALPPPCHRSQDGPARHLERHLARCALRRRRCGCRT